MAEYWRVSPNLWAHARRERWDEDTRTLAVYLLTCPHRTTEGFFWLPRPYVWADLGWAPERLDVAWDRLAADDFLAYDDAAEVLLLVKAMKYQRPDNENQHKAAIRALAQLPPNRLWPRFRTVAAEYAQAFAQALAKALPEPFGVPAEEPAEEPATDSPAPTPAPIRMPDPEVSDAPSGSSSPAEPATGLIPMRAREIGQAWNAAVKGTPLPAVRELTEKRAQKLRTRTAGHPERDADWWSAYFARIAASPLCRGEVPAKDGAVPWIADFDWAIRDETVVARVLEGRYDTRKPPTRASPSVGRAVPGVEETAEILRQQGIR